MEDFRARVLAPLPMDVEAIVVVLPVTTQHLIIAGFPLRGLAARHKKFLNIFCDLHEIPMILVFFFIFVEQVQKQFRKSFLIDYEM